MRGHFGFKTAPLRQSVGLSGEWSQDPGVLFQVCLTKESGQRTHANVQAVVGVQ